VYKLNETATPQNFRIMTNTLIEILFRETQTLKSQYVEFTKEYAEKLYAKLAKMAAWKEVDWCSYFRIAPRTANAGTANEYQGFPSNFYNTKDARTFDRLRAEAKNAVRAGQEAFVAKEEAAAVKHYEDSIEKLAERVAAKGLNLPTLKVGTSHVGVNIETTLTDGEKTIRAFTIVAAGAVQRPHYRYLIK
jgi:hypothetical protein